MVLGTKLLVERSSNVVEFGFESVNSIMSKNRNVLKFNLAVLSGCERMQPTL